MPTLSIPVRRLPELAGQSEELQALTDFFSEHNLRPGDVVKLDIPVESIAKGIQQMGVNNIPYGWGRKFVKEKIESLLGQS